MERSKVYFTKEITPESIVRMYDVCNKELTGHIAIKVHSGEEGKNHLIERIESKNGIHTIEAAASLGFGSREYDLIDVDQ